MADDPSCLRKALSSAAKRKVKEENGYERLNTLTSLEKQGQMLAASADEEVKKTSTCSNDWWVIFKTEIEQ